MFKGFTLYETFSDPVRVTGREMRVLKSLCRSQGAEEFSLN